MSYNEKIETMLDELQFINEKLHSEEKNLFAAYAARLDFLGDAYGLHDHAKKEAISGTKEIADYCAAIDLLLEIEKGYEVFGHGYILTF